MIRDRLKFGPLRVGIGGPVGAGKTSMTEALCKILASDVSMAVITNDIYTREDAESVSYTHLTLPTISCV